MRRITRNSHVSILLSGALAVVTSIGCGDRPQRFGEAIDPKAPRVTLAELLANADAYEGKDVTVGGQYSGKCGDGDFFFKDQFNMIEADPPSPDLLSLQKGTPIRLYGKVKVRRRGGGDAAPGSAEVRIVGKGVEVEG